MYRYGIWTLRLAVLAAALLMAATPASAQRIRFGIGQGYNPGGYYGGYGSGYRGYSGYYPGNYYSGYGGYNRPYYSGYSTPYYSGYSTPYYSGYNQYSYPSSSIIQSGYYTPPYSTVTPYVPDYSAPVARAEDNTATVRVRVPANAEVWFDDTPTRQTGEMRTFESPPLSTDRTFHYNVRARWMEGDQVKEETRKVEVRANQTSEVNFMRP